MNSFNSGQFKVRMKKMAAQVNFYLYANAFLSSELFGVWKLAHICQIKALLTYFKYILTKCVTTSANVNSKIFNCSEQVELPEYNRQKSILVSHGIFKCGKTYAPEHARCLRGRVIVGGELSSDDGDYFLCGNACLILNFISIHGLNPAVIINTHHCCGAFSRYARCWKCCFWLQNIVEG